MTFSSEWEFEVESSSPHHQQGNGKSQAAVKAVKLLLKKDFDSGGNFHKNILRNTPNKTEYSPQQTK